MRVTGIGGVFFKAKDSAVLREWYRRHLEIQMEEWGGATFRWQTQGNPHGVGSTTWTVFDEDTTYFGSTAARFMINYRVENLETLLSTLREEGCSVDDKIEKSEFGKFGWVTDPEGNRIELWEPPPGQ